MLSHVFGATIEPSSVYRVRQNFDNPGLSVGVYFINKVATGLTGQRRSTEVNPLFWKGIFPV